MPLHPDTIQRLLTRFRKAGLAVREDRPHPGRAPGLTAEMRTTLLECLRLPDRAGTCAQLAEVVHQQYGVAVCIETVRALLRRAGFVGRRTRYVPAQRPDPQAYADAQADLAPLQRGLGVTCGSDGLWMRRGAA